MSKTLLFFAVALILYIGYGIDFKNEVKNDKNKLLLINTKIEKNRYILTQKDKIKKQIQQQLGIDKLNREKLFSESINNSIALGEIQNFVKSVAEKLNIEVVMSNWGEPELKNEYKKLPVSFVLRAYPQQLKPFFDKIYSYQKFLKIETFTTGKYKKEK